MKRFISMVAVCLLAGGIAVLPVSAEGAVLKEEPTVEVAYSSSAEKSIPITPFASVYLSDWTPIVGSSYYGADVYFNGSYSGSLTVELHNSSGKIDSFTQSFTNVKNILALKNRTQSSGKYKIVIKLTINGTLTERESSFISI